MWWSRQQLPLGDFAREPLHALVQALARQSAARLNVPAVVLEGRQVELFGDFRGTHGALWCGEGTGQVDEPPMEMVVGIRGAEAKGHSHLQILLVCKDEHAGGLQVLLGGGGEGGGGGGGGGPKR